MYLIKCFRLETGAAFGVSAKHENNSFCSTILVLISSKRVPLLRSHGVNFIINRVLFPFYLPLLTIDMYHDYNYSLCPR
jgi:hypothetical protein